MRRLRKSLAIGAIAAMSITGMAACSDDDKDGNPEVDVPEDVDVDVDRGEDKPGD